MSQEELGKEVLTNEHILMLRDAQSELEKIKLHAASLEVQVSNHLLEIERLLERNKLMSRSLGMAVGVMVFALLQWGRTLL